MKDKPPSSVIFPPRVDVRFFAQGAKRWIASVWLPPTAFFQKLPAAGAVIIRDGGIVARQNLGADNTAIFQIGLCFFRRRIRADRQHDNRLGRNLFRQSAKSFLGPSIANGAPGDIRDHHHSLPLQRFKQIASCRMLHPAFALPIRNARTKKHIAAPKNQTN